MANVGWGIAGVSALDNSATVASTTTGRMNGAHNGAGTTQQIDGCEGFDFLETRRQQAKNTFAHGGTYTV